MGAESKLDRIAWLYVLVGSYALIDQLLALFGPGFSLDREIVLDTGFTVTPSSAHLSLCGIDLSILWLPAGIGLLRRRVRWHAVAILLNWLFLAVIAIGLAISLASLAFGVATGWVERMYDVWGAKIYREFLIGGLIVLPVFVWQFRTLRSREIRDWIAAARSQAQAGRSA